MFDLSNPIVQSALLPLISAAILIGLIRLVGGPGRGGRMAALGAVLGALIGLYLIVGLPPFPPTASTHKLGYLMVAGALLGALAQAVGLRGKAAIAAMAIWTGLGLLWLAESRFAQGAILAPAVIVIGGAVGAGRLAAISDNRTDGAVVLMVAAVGLSLVAILGRSASIAQSAAALAAATGGYLLWNWPRQRHPFAPAAVLGLGALTFFFGGQAGLYSGADPLALFVLLLALFADLPARRLAFGGSLLREATTPVLVGLFAALATALAAAIAYFSSGGI